MAKLTPIYPSAAIRDTYQRRLDAPIDRMSRDVTKQLTRAYRENEPVAYALYGQDASPARVMSSLVRALARKWQGQFDDLAPNLAQWFAKAVKDRCDRELAAMLRAGGMSVKFKMTAAMNDAFQAVKAENVGLIKSIPSQYFTQVETMVMQSVQNGRDVGYLAQQLQDRLGVTKRRAATIALDQNNKATSTMLRARQLSMGITEGRWLHSAGGKVPRPPHVAFSGKTFDLAKGHDFDDGEGAVLPGQPINCRCVWKPVIPGFDD